MGLRKIWSVLTLNERGMAYAIEKKRNIISRDLSRLYNNTVQHGIFKGLKFPRGVWWGETSRAAMLLGIYEAEILEALMQLPEDRDVFVNLGAADGYYSVGLLHAGRVNVSYAFEMSEKGRTIISENAAINKCSHGLHIFGKADLGFYKLIPKSDLDRAVMLIDIEGAEFSILNEETLKELKNTIIIIELHDWFFEDGVERLKRLKQVAGAHFKVSTLTTRGRDLSVFSDLVNYSDSERWLIASEGRKKMMGWLRLDPL